MLVKDTLGDMLQNAWPALLETVMIITHKDSVRNYLQLWEHFRTFSDIKEPAAALML